MFISLTKSLPYGFIFVTVKRTLAELPVLQTSYYSPVFHTLSPWLKSATTFISVLQRVVSGLFHYGFMATNRHRNIMGDIGDWLLTNTDAIGSH